jgi:hypothetical protein
MCPLLTSRHSQLDAGFRYFVGYIWETASRNLDWVVPWLKTIFGPLIKVAVNAYDAKYVPPYLFHMPGLTGLQPTKEIKRNENRESTKGVTLQYVLCRVFIFRQ